MQKENNQPKETITRRNFGFGAVSAVAAGASMTVALPNLSAL